MYNYDVTKEILEKYVKESEHYSEVLRKLNWRVHTNFYKRLKLIIEKYQIDCSHFKKFKKIINIKQDLKEILVENSTRCSNSLKHRLLKEKLLENKCNFCGITIWLDKPIILQLDHINGIHNDNRIENLRLLCPNCHSQTDTYSGKNCNYENNHKENYCIDCGDKIYRNSKRCRKCSHKHNMKIIDRPIIETLLKEVSEIGYNETGRKHKVCGNTIKKWLKKTTNIKT
jgi:hypothetical protein